LDLGSRQVIDIVLHRLVRKGTIRRLARGIYDFLKLSPDEQRLYIEQAAIQRNVSPVIMEKDF
jgi:hypothetical protein